MCSGNKSDTLGVRRITDGEFLRLSVIPRKDLGIMSAKEPTDHDFSIGQHYRVCTEAFSIGQVQPDMSRVAEGWHLDDGRA